MLYAAHAAFQAPIDGTRGIGVSHDIQVGRLGFLDGGPDLLPRELGGVNAVGGRRDSTTEHEFEMGGTTSDFLAGCLAYFIHTIADDGPSQATVTEIMRLPARAAKIAMPARLRERRAGKEEARPLQVAFFNGLSQSVIGSAHVAHRREAAPQHARQHA